MDNLEQSIRYTTSYESPFDSYDVATAAAHKQQELAAIGITELFESELGLTAAAQTIHAVAFQALRFMTLHEGVRTTPRERLEMEDALKRGMFFADWVHEPSMRPLSHPVNHYAIERSLDYTKHQFIQANNDADFSVPLARHASRMQLIDAEDAIVSVGDAERNLIELGAYRHLNDATRQSFRIGYGILRKAMFEPYSVYAEGPIYAIQESGVQREMLDSFRVVRELQPPPKPDDIMSYYQSLEMIAERFNSLEFVRHYFQPGLSVNLTRGVAQFINPSTTAAARTYQRLGAANGMRLQGTLNRFEAHSRITPRGYEVLMDRSRIEARDIQHAKVASLAMALSDVTVSFGHEPSEWRHVTIPQTVIIPLELPGQEISIQK